MYEFKNNAGERFSFFVNEEGRASLNIYFKDDLLTGFILDRVEFEELIDSLVEMNEEEVIQ